MKGYHYTFFTEQGQKHRGTPMGDWLISVARELNLPGATLVVAAGGYGKSGRMHAAHLVERSDQPLQVSLAVSAAQAEELMQWLRAEEVDLFYVRTEAVFGRVDEDSEADGEA